VRDVGERFKDILEAIEDIERYVSKGKDAFDNDELIQSWCLRQLQIIGEAARSISGQIKNQTKQIPWSKIIAMRHIITHEYFRIDKALVWHIVSNDLPELKPQILTAMKKFTEKS
jgi:uncharacterized protein with HEPN domain